MSEQTRTMCKICEELRLQHPRASEGVTEGELHLLDRKGVRWENQYLCGAGWSPGTFDPIPM